MLFEYFYEHHCFITCLHYSALQNVISSAVTASVFLELCYVMDRMTAEITVMRVQTLQSVVSKVLLP